MGIEIIIPCYAPIPNRIVTIKTIINNLGNIPVVVEVALNENVAEAALEEDVMEVMGKVNSSMIEVIKAKHFKITKVRTQGQSSFDSRITNSNFMSLQNPDDVRARNNIPEDARVVSYFIGDGGDNAVNSFGSTSSLQPMKTIYNV